MYCMVGSISTPHTHTGIIFPFCRVVTSKVLYLCFKPNLPISFSVPSQIYFSEALQPSWLAGPVTSHCHTQLWQGMTSSVNSPAWLGIPGRQRSMVPCNIMGLSSPADIDAKQKRGYPAQGKEVRLSSPSLVTTFCRSKHNPNLCAPTQKFPCLG